MKAKPNHFKKINIYANLLSDAAWREIDTILDDIARDAQEHIEHCIVDQQNGRDIIIDVLRFIQYKNHTKEIHNKNYTELLLKIFKEEQVVSKIEKITGLEHLDILRMQMNLMGEGSYLPPHYDTSYSEDFLITSIFKTQDYHCNGGELKVENLEHPIKQTKHSSFILDASKKHEVTPIKQGQRNTLIAVLGKHQE